MSALTTAGICERLPAASVAAVRDAARADRHARGDGGGDVGDAHRHQLAVHLELVVVAPGRGAGDEQALGDRQHGDGDRGAEQVDPRPEVERRERQRRQARRDLAEHRHAAGLEQVDRAADEHERDQRTGQLRGEPLAQPEDDDGRHADDDARDRGVGELLTISTTSVNHSPVSTLMFRIFSTCDVRISMPSPARNPTSTDFEMNRTIVPAFSEPEHDEHGAGEHRHAERELLGIAPLSAATDGITPASRAAMVASGPMTSCRDPENRANAMIGQDRGVDADDDRQPGRLGVADVERQRERGERDAGEDLGDQTGAAARQEHRRPVGASSSPATAALDLGP